MSALQRIEHTRHALGEALAARDWAAIGSLDLQCRQCLDGVLNDPEMDAERLRSNLEQLLELYRELVDASRGERQAAFEEMSQFRQARNASKVYHLFK
ncbi:flagellar protein FliT [Pseudomonas sp. NPDC007930]|uniref:flagellar protein FliT n=1 Tax=Pseudomonas sp. NPDC007930 TaxID=3364417 RepID=UPI0036E24876